MAPPQALALPPLADQVAPITEAANADLWRTIGPVDSADAALQALLDTLPSIIDKYGEAAGAVAADHYENDRDLNLIPGHFSAQVPDMGDTGAEELARWAVTPLYDNPDDPDWASTQSRVEGGLQRRVANHARQTIMSSAVADPQSHGWQRITSPEGGCGFCTMLASRGAVYTSEYAADFGAHDYCQCQAVSAWEGRTKPVQPYRPSKHQATDAEKARTREWIKKNLPGVEEEHHARARAKKKLGPVPAPVPVPKPAPAPAPVPAPAPAEPELALRRAPDNVFDQDDLDATNPNYSTGKQQWQNNCTRCATAIELRQRGYEVTAEPKPRGVHDNTMREVMRKWRDPDGVLCGGPPRAAPPRGDPTVGMSPSPRVFDVLPPASGPSNRRAIEDAVQGWGDGARGYVNVVWKGRSSAHIFNVENRDGQVVFIDGQNGKEGASVADYFNRVSPSGASVYVVRTDDLTPTTAVGDWVRSRTDDELAAEGNKKAMLKRQAERHAEELNVVREMEPAATARGYGPNSGHYGNFAVGMKDAYTLREPTPGKYDDPEAQAAYEAGFRWYREIYKARKGSK